jgi:hypothetical protein
MGWTWTHRPHHQPVMDYVKEQFTWETERVRVRVLDASLVRFRTAYLACETLHKDDGRTEVWAGVCLVGYAPKSYYNIGTKEIDETMGPCESECPQRILDLLTPTNSQWANEWRQRCWRYHAARRAKHKRKAPCGAV